jgi:glycosyltransferase involved in cell wall biosynthesis
MPSNLIIAPTEEGVAESSSRAPWDEWAERIVIHTPIYLGFDGEPSTGGRERHIRDLAHVIRDQWRRPLTIVQMAHRDFESVCPDGFPVVGRRAEVRDARGEPGLGWWLHRRFARPRDAVLYAAGERAWPFFRTGSKGVQHGVWWDGPLPYRKRWLQGRRMERFASRMRSVLCVDTNFINWMRARGPTGLELSRRCVYLPNYADVPQIDAGDPDRRPSRPMRLLYARRFQPCRGPFLFLDALALLRRRGVPFHADLFTVGGTEELEEGLRLRGLEAHATVRTESLDGILACYRAADVAVVPTVWSEGTSFACVEALCAGVPVVCTPVGGLANLVVPGFNGYVVPPVPEAFAAAIARLQDEDTWRSMRRAALSMRPALSMQRWREQALDWIRA